MIKNSKKHFPKKIAEILVKDAQGKRIEKDKVAFFKADEGMWIEVFQHKIDNTRFTISDPNPILILLQ